MKGGGRRQGEHSNGLRGSGLYVSSWFALNADNLVTVLAVSEGPWHHNVMCTSRRSDRQTSDRDLLPLVFHEISVRSNELICMGARGGFSQQDGEEKGNNLGEGSDE